ncbi:MAG TPA: AsmA-like C-terminal region-containing protein [Flavobacteriales bacterium]|nr:AsmA-like C-terminal region-containing protein [Flavobacteriales bacterium]
MLRIFRRAALPVLASLAGLLLVLAGLGWFFQDEVKAKLVAELNTHLTAPLHQNGIELTLIKRFPQASLRIRDAYMQEVRADGKERDTLLYAKDLYLEFSLFSLLTGNPVVRELHGTDVCLYPGLDSNGNGNWAVWKSDTTAAETGNGADIDLRRVTFNGLRARYRDDGRAMEVLVHSEKMALGGHFRHDGSQLKAKGDVWLRHWLDGKDVVHSDRKAAIEAAMLFGGGDGSFRIEKGELTAGKNTLGFALAIAPDGAGNNIDLRANGFGLDLAGLVLLLPDNLQKTLRRYGMAGHADLALHFSGPLQGSGPSLTLGMKLRDGRFTELASGTAFRKVQGEFAAEFTPDWKPRELLVRSFSATSPSGSISGALSLNGQKNAKVLIDAQGDLALSDLLRFAGLDTLEQVSGRLKAQAHVQGRLRDVADFRATDLKGLAITGSVQLKDASLKMKGLRHRVTGLNAEMALAGNDALVHGLRFQLQGNAMELTGTLRNLVPYALFDDQKLTIEAKGSAPSIDLATLLETAPSNSAKASTAYAFTLPALIDLDLKADIGTLKMEKFQADGITMNVRMAGQRLMLEPLEFRTAEGKVTGSLALDARPAQAYPLTIRADLRGINISTLFTEFQDFGQQFITAKHVKGKGNAQLLFTAPLLPDFSLDQDRLHCVADVSLTNGELNDHASLMAVADYLKGNKLIAPFVDTKTLRKELKHVRFAKLENRIEIKDRQVHLPLMTVNSSLMDLEVSGTHGFDGQVDDHLSFRLGDLFRAGRAQQDEFGPIIDDGTGLRIFLHMFGTTDNLQFGNDGAMAAARRRQRMKEETAELKGILKGIVSGDGAKAGPTTAQQGQITVQFGDEGTVAHPEPGTKPKKGLGRLLQKDNKKDPPPVITIE